MKKKLKGSNIIIREELVKDNLLLLKEAIKHFGGKGNVWTLGSKIFAKVSNKILQIKSNTDIDNAIDKQ